MADQNEPSRRPLIVANWKMNKDQPDTESFIKTFLTECPMNLDRDVVLCPPYPFLLSARGFLEGSKIQLGAQNNNENSSGAHTGEVSSSMLASVGCHYVIIGHSERRQFYRETDALINKKIKAALGENLIPIVCVGEKLEEREAGKTMAVVSAQVKGVLEELPSAQTKKLVFAYEPIWAIGTGKTATPEQAQEVHLKIRDILKDLYGSMTSHLVRILYGGSVKPDNMAQLMACEDIDGGLVGGASLEPKSFLKIVQFESLQKTR